MDAQLVPPPQSVHNVTRASPSAQELASTVLNKQTAKAVQPQMYVEHATMDTH